jgi:hypothetical protein
MLFLNIGLGLKLPIILDNPEKWVPLPAQSLSTQRSDEFWVMCSGNPKKPVFEVLTKEFVVAFAWELFKTAEMLSNTKQLSNITILEVYFLMIFIVSIIFTKTIFI